MSATPPQHLARTPDVTRAPRTSLTSFSFGPQQLAQSLLSGSPSSQHRPTHHRQSLDANGSFIPAAPVNSSPRAARRRKSSLAGTGTGGSRHPLSYDSSHNTTDDSIMEDDEADVDDGTEEVPLEMLDRMRLWRHDAMMQHLYSTSVFWGDKILSWTNDPNDAFWLAQTHFFMHQYARAEKLLTRPFPVDAAPAPPPLLLNGKGKERDDANNTSSMSGFGQIPAGSSSTIHLQVNEEGELEMSRLVDMSVACRYLAAQCQVRQGKIGDAMEMLGESNPFAASARSGPSIPNTDGGIKIEASMCYLRGLLHLKMNRSDKAKTDFLEALALDVKCYEAFDILISGEMMGVDEEWAFVQGLKYREQSPEDAEFIRLMYTVRLKKYKHTEEIALARQKLFNDYQLGNNCDLMYAFADSLYTQFRWADCFAITSKIMELVGVHTPSMPLHIACMYHLSHLRSQLFMLAHELVDREPESAMSWYAVGVWYLASGKYGEARKYFSKATLMDPRHSAAWCGFGHTYAFEGEHDQAVIAYSSTSRMFGGSHLPHLYIGMENIQLMNLILAEESLAAAALVCDSDPLLLNEMGVVAFMNAKYHDAVHLFTTAIEYAKVVQSSQNTWATTYVNLGTAYRKLGKLQDAKATYLKVLEIDHRHVVGLGNLGMTHHLLDELDQAINRYHEALSVDPLDTNIVELLNHALEAEADQPLFGKKGIPGGEEMWRKGMGEQKARADNPRTSKSGSTSHKSKKKVVQESAADMSVDVSE